jgi:hypothetical protein
LRKAIFCTDLTAHPTAGEDFSMHAVHTKHLPPRPARRQDASPFFNRMPLVLC